MTLGLRGDYAINFAQILTQSRITHYVLRAMTQQSPVPRVLAIHDLSGFGRAALTVVIPILSTMGIQVCPLPTAVFSTHGMFLGYRSLDLTDYLRDCLQHWRELNLRFDAIYSGFLNSARQLDLITSFLRDIPHQDRFVVIDPVLGDNGRLYGVTPPDLVAAMRAYIRLADVITPNLTEAALLLDEPYQTDMAEEAIKEWLIRLAEAGPDTVIITSVPVVDLPSHAAVLAYNRIEGICWRVLCERIPATFPGTGDAFTSIIVGSLLQGHSLPVAVDRAVQFISLAIRTAVEFASPEREGILLEGVLDILKLSPIQ